MDLKSKIYYYFDWIPLLATAGIATVQMLIALLPVMLHILGIR